MLRLDFGAWRPFLIVRYLLTFALVPLLILTLPQPAANATTKNGPSVAFSWKWDSAVPGKFGNCTASAHWNRVNAAQPTIVVSGMSCSLGWNFSGTISGDAGDYFTAQLACDPNGGFLKYSTHSFQHSNSGGGFTLTPTDSTGVFPNDCTVASIDLDYKDEGWGQDSTYGTTVTLPLGSPPAPTTAADAGTPSGCEPFLMGKVRVISGVTQPSWTSAGAGAQVGHIVRVTGTILVPNTRVSVYAWGTVGGVLKELNIGRMGPGSTGRTISNGYEHWNADNANPLGILDAPDLTFTVWSSSYDSSSFNDAEAALVTGEKRRLPTSDYTSGAKRWLTEPDYCLWTMGTKRAANNPSSTVDDPFGPVTFADGGVATGPDDPAPADVNPAPENVDDGGCAGFSFTDPASWAGAGICVLVKAIGGLIDVVQELLHAVAGLAAAILDGLKGLLIPSPGFLDGKVAEVKSAFSDSTPGNYVAGITGIQVPTGTSGCAGPPVDFTIAGSDQHWEPLNACSGAMGNMAALCKLAITIGVALAGGLACMRALGSGFGWNPGVGQGAGS